MLETPESPDLVGYLRAAREAGAEHLRLAGGAVPYCRVQGRMTRFEGDALSPEAALGLWEQSFALSSVEAGDDVDAMLELDELGRFRVNAHRHRMGAALSVKCVPEGVRTLHELGLPEELYELTAYRLGLVLVTGPAGCGKSSTLSSLLQRVNETRPDHVVTIESPIETRFESAMANVTQREVGVHTKTFDAALRAALREDPDVILVSELSDLATIRTALVAAETGHLVLGTLHTRDASSTISRILDVFPPREQPQIRTMLAGTLRAVVSQRLLPRKWAEGRVPAYEILRVTPAVSTLIRDGRLAQLPSAMQTGRKHGMIDLDSCLDRLVRENQVEAADALRFAKDPTRFGGGR